MTDGDGSSIVSIDGLTKMNNIAGDLGDILITASSSREPPAMMENDTKSLSNDLDRDDIICNDVIRECDDINDTTSRTIFKKNVETSSPFSELKTHLVDRTTPFDFLAGKGHTDDSFSKSISPSTRKVPSSNTESTAGSTIDPRFVEKLESSNVMETSSKIRTYEVDFRSPENASNPICPNSRAESSKQTSSKVDEESSSNSFLFDKGKSDDVLDELFAQDFSPKVPISQVDRISLESSASIGEERADEASVSETTHLFTDNNIEERAILTRMSSLSRKYEETKEPSKISYNITADIFANDVDDEELFSSRRKSSIAAKERVVKNLFEDDDDDEDDNGLFGAIAVPSRSESSIG